MNELERRLAALGAEIAYPPTPRFDHAFDRRAAAACHAWRPLAIALRARSS